MRGRQTTSVSHEMGGSATRGGSLSLVGSEVNRVTLGKLLCAGHAPSNAGKTWTVNSIGKRKLNFIDT